VAGPAAGPHAEARFVRPRRVKRLTQELAADVPEGDIVRVLGHPIAILGFVMLAGCTFRHRLAVPFPATLPPDQRVEVWQGAQRTVLTHVAFDSAAVAGQVVPWQPACGSCRVAIPRAQVDSVVLVNHDVAWAIGGTVGLVTLWMLKHCWPATACFD